MSRTVILGILMLFCLVLFLGFIGLNATDILGTDNHSVTNGDYSFIETPDIKLPSAPSNITCESHGLELIDSNMTWEEQTVIISGTLKNTQKKNFTAIDIYFEVLDKSNQTLATLSAGRYYDDAGDWNFQAVAAEPDAVSYRLLSICGLPK